MRCRSGRRSALEQRQAEPRSHPAVRRDPRCTLYVHATSPAWRGLETTVTLLDGPDAPELNLRLFRVMQGRPAGPLWWYGHELDETAFVDQMRAERRLVYEFEVERSYGPRP
jgi:hypothetical protein